MSQLIALIIAIALGAIVTAIGYVFLGDAFQEQSTKAEAQKILVQAEQIEAAMIAYKVDHGGQIDLGDSDPNLDGCTDEVTCSDNQIFAHLIGDGYLKENINQTLSDLTLSWHYDSSDGVVQRIVPDATQCMEANHQRHGFPEEGLQDGDAMFGSRTADGADLNGGVPTCGTPTAVGVACCVQ